MPHLEKIETLLDAHIVLGRIVSGEGVALGDMSGWLNEAENAYRRAEKLSDESQDVAWYWAQSYAMAGELGWLEKNCRKYWLLAAVSG